MKKKKQDYKVSVFEAPWYLTLYWNDFWATEKWMKYSYYGFPGMSFLKVCRARLKILRHKLGLWPHFAV